MNDPYQFSIVDETISDSPRTRSSSRQRALTTKQSENHPKKKLTTTIKRAEKGSKELQPQPQLRVGTRSSQRSPVTSYAQNNDQSLIADAKTGFSQFVNSKKRNRDDKSIAKTKRSKKDIYIDENDSPANEIQNEIRSIEKVKLVYETAGGRTNLMRAATNNAAVLANLDTWSHQNIAGISAKNTTYTISRQYPNLIEETQAETLAIPDTLINNDSQHNDSSWQKDIDRLMKKLEEPSSVLKSQSQLEETQCERTHEEYLKPVYHSQTTTNKRTQPILITNSTTITQSEAIQPGNCQTETVAIQTDDNQLTLSLHVCCQDISVCPCVLRYSKLEHLFMEKMSKFINFIPTIQNSTRTTSTSDACHRSRPFQYYSRWRRTRNRWRYRRWPRSRETPEHESIETDDENVQKKIECNNQGDKNNEPTCQESANPIPTAIQTEDNTIIEDKTISKDTILEGIAELSSIEKMDTTINHDHASTLLISATNESTTIDSIPRRLVLTASSLDENQKIQYRGFVAHFGVSTTSNVDSSTTHIIVSENSSLVCPLTGKIIQGIARHLFIVSYRWLIECLAENSIVDERPFEIRGDSSLGSDHGGMRRSRLTPTYLLENYSICLRCSPNDCAPLQNVEQVQELIELCGGKLLHHFSEIQSIDKQRDIVLVLGINGFAGSEKKRQTLLDTCQQFNVKCVNIHWLLISIAKYEIQAFDNYDISQL